jgi:hypothetical protein
MSRRYLTSSEAEAAMNRGRSVECFLGSCQRESKPGIKWFSVRASGNGIKVSVYETADLGNEDFIDIYGFGPLNPDLKLEDPDEIIEFSSFSEFFSEIEEKFSGSTSKLVNEFIIQDEYADYIARGRE